jgi:hypothetical protein
MKRVFNAEEMKKKVKKDKYGALVDIEQPTGLPYKAEEIKKHEGGRPTDYCEETLTKTREYIDNCEDTYEVIIRPKIENGKHLGDEEFRKETIKIPTIEGLAVYLKLNKDTIYTWRKDEEKKEFSDLIEELLAKQADRLLNKGLSGEYSPVIAKVLLTKHGYREGIEQTGKDGKDLFEPSAEDMEKIKNALANF